MEKSSNSGNSKRHQSCGSMAIDSAVAEITERLEKFFASDEGRCALGLLARDDKRVIITEVKNDPGYVIKYFIDGDGPCVLNEPFDVFTLYKGVGLRDRCIRIDYKKLAEAAYSIGGMEADAVMNRIRYGIDNLRKKCPIPEHGQK